MIYLKSLMLCIDACGLLESKNDCNRIFRQKFMMSSVATQTCVVMNALAGQRVENIKSNRVITILLFQLRNETMARRKHSHSSCRKNHGLRSKESRRERLQIEEYSLNNAGSSDTSDPYIEDEEIGNSSTSHKSTEVSLSQSTAINTAEVLQFRKSRVPSWSDSSGDSTYVSGEFQITPQHAYQKQVKSNKADWSANDSTKLDILLLSPDGNPREKGWTERVTRKLEGIPIYPAVEEAFSNTDLSAIESLQKETARSIFCKRIVPLEIPKRTSYEEISAVSIAEDPSEIVLSTRCKTHDRPVQRLMNVDYVPSIEVAVDNEDISTVAYRMPYKIAHQAFGRSKKPADIPMELPRLIIHSHSHSTLSSMESNSDVESQDDSNGDADSNEATRQPKATTARAGRQTHEHTNRVGDLENGLSNEKSDVSSDARIRDLKNKIQKLRNAPISKREIASENADIHRRELPPMKSRKHHSSDPHDTEEISKKIYELTLATGQSRERSPTKLREQHHTDLHYTARVDKRIRDLTLEARGQRREESSMKSREQHTADFHDTERITKRIKELTHAAKEQRRKRGANFVDDTTGGLAHDFHSNRFDTRGTHGDFTSEDVRISETRNSLAFGRGEFPIVVHHHARQDDISTINDNPGTYQASDMETALRNALERKREKSVVESREAREKLKGVIIDYFTRGKDFISTTLKETTKGQQRSAIQQTWDECMEGRSTGEKTLIVAVSIALVVLFILLIVVLAGR